MKISNRSISAGAIAGVVAALLGACKMDVVYPGVIDASQFDPSADAATLSLSAQSNLYRGYGALVYWSAFFSGEAWVGAVRQETNDIARRVQTSATSDVASVWTPLQRSLATNELAIQVLDKGAGAASDVNLARVEMNAGFSLVLIAETFCQGTILVGPPLTPTDMLDTAIARFTKAVAIGGATTAAEGAKIVSASNVGLARAYLQKKDYARAAAAAALVPATFAYNAIAIDDAGNRGLGSLGNQPYIYDVGSNAIIVPDAYRALNDPRVKWVDAGKKAQDTQFQYYQQLKYASYGTPIRIASGLEASYIAAEAKLQTGDPSAATTLIAARRTANGQPAFTGTGNAAILAELMNQRAREFWLEAKHLGDWLRNGAATPFVPPAGSPFYKPAQGAFGSTTCLPVPIAEINANPNFPKS